jgi:endonuclease YncB( thermonuclease family)
MSFEFIPNSAIALNTLINTGLPPALPLAETIARAFRRYSEDYVVDEDAARQSRANIWSGDLDMPWDWRAQR